MSEMDEVQQHEALGTWFLDRGLDVGFNVWSENEIELLDDDDLPAVAQVLGVEADSLAVKVALSRLYKSL